MRVKKGSNLFHHILVLNRSQHKWQAGVWGDARENGRGKFEAWDPD